jgi:predicted dienelactone hydrolase
VAQAILTASLAMGPNSSFPKPEDGKEMGLRSFRRLRRRRAAAGPALLAVVWFFAPAAAGEERLFAAGMTQVEFRDPADGTRPIDFLLIYPAPPDNAAPPTKLPLSANLRLFRDAAFAPGERKRPLVVFSHGAGGNASGYAWFGEFLAERGYVVAMAYHYRANTFDTSALYVRNRLWQRPLDLSLIITRLLQDPVWSPRLDPDRIGVAGHSQGGFTALWIGGAEVDPAQFEAYQRAWKSNYAVPAYLRDAMEVDAGPTRRVRDSRVKAAFAMAPGDLKGFGMDEAGLAKMKIPTYLIVGAGDKATPTADNAGFAAKFISNAHLDVLAGPVGHEIFGNECDDVGRDNYPDACVDAPGVDRARLHTYIGKAALDFFNRALGTPP